MTEEMNTEMKELIKMYSAFREKLKGMDQDERIKITKDYIDGDFNADLAQFSGIAVKLYTYLGYHYFEDTISGIIKMIKSFNKMDRISF